MSKKKIVVVVGSLEDMANEAIKVWHQAEAGKIPKGAPIRKVYCENKRLKVPAIFMRKRNTRNGCKPNTKLTRNAIQKIQEDVVY